MCRFVTVVLFVSCVSFGVLVEGVTNNTNTTCKIDDPKLSAKRLEWQQCFKYLVKEHLNLPVSEPSDCHNVSDFGEKFDAYIKLLNTECNTTIIIDTKNLLKLIEFSLKNDSFKKFYGDIDCVKKYEYNISNDCVKTKVGFFDIKKERKHTTWITKTKLKYTSNSCSTSKKVSDCVQAILHKCKPDTEEYMAKLFDYTRELGNCSQFPDVTPAPTLQDKKNAAAAPWLTTPICLLAVLMHVCVQKLKVR